MPNSKGSTIMFGKITCYLLPEPLLSKRHTVPHQYFQLRAMDKARNKYISVEHLSSGEVFAMLDSVNSDDEYRADNFIRNSDTEFVITEPLGSGPSSCNPGHSVLVLEASIHVTNV